MLTVIIIAAVILYAWYDITVNPDQFDYLKEDYSINVESFIPEYRTIGEKK